MTGGEEFDGCSWWWPNIRRKPHHSTNVLLQSNAVKEPTTVQFVAEALRSLIWNFKKERPTYMSEDRYGLKNDEQLEADLESVVRRVLDVARNKVNEPFNRTAKWISWPICVSVYRKMELPTAEKLANWALDYLLERLDEEYGDPDGSPQNPTRDMQVAALALGNAVRVGYTSWACEPTGEIIKVTCKQAKEMVGD